MTIGFVAILVFLKRTPAPPKNERVSIMEPLRALRHRALRGSGLTAIFYNFGFFTLLAYTPFPLHLGIHQLGYTFTAWGLLLAIFAVFVAPRVGRRYGDVRGLGGALAAIVAILLLMGVLHASQTALIVCVIASGAFLGITNTLMTQVVMESAPVPRPIASSAYSFLRFVGGAIAPFVAGKLGEHVSVQAPFYLGAVMTAIGIGVLWTYRDALRPVAATVTALPLPTARLTQAVGEETPDGARRRRPTAREVSALAAPLARAAPPGPRRARHRDGRARREDVADLESATHASAARLLYRRTGGGQRSDHRRAAAQLRHACRRRRGNHPSRDWTSAPRDRARARDTPRAAERRQRVHRDPCTRPRDHPQPRRRRARPAERERSPR